MKLSIIIPVYNVEKHIAICLESLLYQDLDYNDYEIIIIDDGSIDNSISVADEFALKYNHIHIFSQINAGVGSARNKGISLAKGEFIYFIDPDDYLASNTLKKIVSYAKESKLDILTFCSKGTTSYRLTKSETDFSQKFIIKKESGVEYIGNRYYKNEVWYYIINREFLIKSGVKFIEGRWMEDAIFTLNIFVKSKVMAYLPIDSHRHVKVEGSAMVSKEPEHYIQVIYDNANAAKELGNLLEEVKVANIANTEFIKRIEVRQQSFVFFLMVRILKSNITFEEVKSIINDMKEIKAYPLDKFLGKDYNGFLYSILTTIFNFKNIYYLIFLTSNFFIKIKKIKLIYK